MNNLIEGIGAYTGTIQNLYDMLETSFPIRFAENDRQASQEEINAIADMPYHVFTNVKLLHSCVLTEIIVIYSILIAITISINVIVFIRNYK